MDPRPPGDVDAREKGVATASPPAARNAALRDPGWLRWLYVATALLLLVPLWGVSRVPSLDGPSHLYNAWVMRHLHDPAYPLFGAHFELHFDPLPNWLIQVLLYLLLAVAPAAVAEKLLLSLYLLLFAATAWWFAGSVERRGAPAAFLALPFAYHHGLLLGLYNFCFAVPLALLSVGAWWRGREDPGWRFALRLNLLLWLCYFAHLVALAMALLSIAVLWMASFDRQRWKRWLLHPLLLAPQLALPLWYVLTHPGDPAQGWPIAMRTASLTQLRQLWYFGDPHQLGPLLACLFAGLVALGVLRRARRPPEHAGAADSAEITPLRVGHWAFLAASAFALLLYFLAPGGVSQGGFLQQRMVLFPFLLALPALARGLGHRSQVVLALSLVALVGWRTAELLRFHRELGAVVESYLETLAPVAPNSRIVPMVPGTDGMVERAVLFHAVAYVAIPKGLLNWNDGHATVTYFPLRFRRHLRRGVTRPDGIGLAEEQYDVARYAGIVDYVHTWGLRGVSPLVPRLRRQYRLIVTSEEGQLWRRRARWNLRPVHP